MVKLGVAMACALSVTGITPAQELQPPQPRSSSTYAAGRIGSVVPQHKDLDGYDNGLAFEVAIGYRASPNFAVEASVGRFAMSRAFSWYDPAGGRLYVEGSADITAIPVMLSAKAIAPIDWLELYALAGCGLYFFSSGGKVTFSLSPTVVRFDHGTSLGVHFGGGLTARLTRQVALGAELKYVVGKVPFWDSYNRFDSILVGGALSHSF